MEVVGWKEPELFVVNPELFSYAKVFRSGVKGVDDKTFVSTKDWSGFVEESPASIMEQYELGMVKVLREAK